MKSHYYLYCSLLLFLYTSANSQSLYINLNSGSSINYALGSIDYISFTSTDMVINLSGGSSNNHSLTTIQNWTYQPLVSSIGSIPKETKPSLDIFPNPSSGELTIDLPDDFKKSPTKVSIMNLSGQRVYELLAEGKQIYLNLKKLGLAPGIYFLHTQIDNKYFINKIILN